MYQERLKEQRVQYICRTLPNTVKEDGVLTEGRTGKIIGSVGDNKYYRNNFLEFY